MEKYFYIEELCPLCHYRGLFPAVYERDGEGYRRKAMVCRQVEDGKCQQSAGCPVFLAAPEQIPRELEWKMCDQLLGRG